MWTIEQISRSSLFSAPTSSSSRRISSARHRSTPRWSGAGWAAAVGALAPPRPTWSHRARRPPRSTPDASPGGTGGSAATSRPSSRSAGRRSTRSRHQWAACSGSHSGATSASGRRVAVDVPDEALLVFRQRQAARQARPPRLHDEGDQRREGRGLALRHAGHAIQLKWHQAPPPTCRRQAPSLAEGLAAASWRSTCAAHGGQIVHACTATLDAETTGTGVPARRARR